MKIVFNWPVSKFCKYLLLSPLLWEMHPSEKKKKGGDKNKLFPEFVNFSQMERNS